MVVAIVLSMADKKIPGIYNYCDRWCERCYFTSRCSVFEEESGIPSNEKDLSNKAFWDRLAINFSKAKKMLEKAAEHYGVDLNSLAKEMDDLKEKQKKIRKESEEHPLSKLSFVYSERSRDWLKSQPGMMQRLEELREGLTLGVESVPDAKTKMEVIKDCLAIIQWYQTFIHVKIVRAFMGRSNFNMNEDDDNDFSDADGSAKIAIIGIDRSMHAWLELYKLLPDREDDFLSVLGMLEKMKTMAVEEFPKALSFKRPGFDE
jgi:hypothetical protein